MQRLVPRYRVLNFAPDILLVKVMPCFLRPSVTQPAKPAELSQTEDSCTHRDDPHDRLASIQPNLNCILQEKLWAPTGNVS